MQLQNKKSPFQKKTMIVQQIKKWLNLKTWFLHAVIAVFVCIIIWELNLLTDYYRIWYPKIFLCWSLVLGIHLLMALWQQFLKKDKRLPG
jgi:hypothetical protein